MISKNIPAYFLFLSLITLTLTGCQLRTTQVDNALQSLPSSQKENRVDSVDFKASFAVFTNGTFRVFTKSMYHERSKDVFISGDNPNIVHVKKIHVTWGDFFNSLPMQLTNNCLTTGTGEKFCATGTKTLKFYINGQKIENFVESEIKPGDKALISYGSETETQIQKQLEQIENP